MLNVKSCPINSSNRWILYFFKTETPPPGYISEDGETSDQQLNQSMDTGKIFTTSKICVYYFTYWQDLSPNDIGNLSNLLFSV